jgi:DNA/RNA-binding domain of Phe-tRNA-synthetase-like protein
MQLPITIRIAKAIFDRFPDMAVHAFRAAGVRDAAVRIDPDKLLVQARDAVLLRGYDLAKITEEPVVKSWREAYARSGLQPSKYRSSIESLLRRALRDGGSIATGIPAVDAYNASSLMHSAPLGGYDAALLPAMEITLRTVDLSDAFVPLGGDPKDFPLKPSLVVYASSNTVVCYGFNCRDNRQTALRAETQDAVFCSESTSATQRTAAQQALSHLKSLLSSAGATTSDLASVDREHPETELPSPQ